MDLEQYKTGGELLKLIENTEKGLSSLILLKKKRRDAKEDRKYDDGQYSLCIGEYSDGSGDTSSRLNRYDGNAELLDIIIETLEVQLERFRMDFSEL